MPRSIRQRSRRAQSVASTGPCERLEARRLLSTYTITGPQVGWTTGTLNFDSTLENVSLNTGKGSNAIYAQNPAAFTGYTVNGNTGDDSMYVDVSNALNGLSFYGGNGAGIDSIQV